MSYEKAPRKTDVRTIRTRASIKNALLSLLEENPLNEISVKDICDHISVNRTTFYTHFKNIGGP
ncbi:MAG: TetR/AcrR family transcriptional regulator [Thermoplasmata archaeon]|nr:TetR/AcrR family transcriptional regulator [Thermoplasmata archaeon]